MGYNTGNVMRSLTAIIWTNSHYLATMSNYHNRIGLCLAVLGTVLLIVSGCSFSGQTRTPSPPLSAQQPPIYPNANNVKVDNTSAINVKRASFQTSDSSSEVQNYYRGVLLNDGWKVDAVSKPATPDSLYLSWGGPGLGGYGMDIVIRSSTNGLLNVEITLVAHNLQM
jgi:hypothetical protein